MSLCVYLCVHTVSLHASHCVFIYLCMCVFLCRVQEGPSGDQEEIFRHSEAAEESKERFEISALFGHNY